MHFHLPKPLHGWREFAGEVGIIVIGVLIALGAEQVVRDLESHRKAAQAESRIRDELGDTVLLGTERLAIQQCLRTRLNDLAKGIASGRMDWSQSVLPPRPGFAPTAFREVYRAPTRNWVDDAYHEALSQGDLDSLSAEKRAGLAAAFKQVANIAQLNETERELSNEVGILQFNPQLTPADRNRLLTTLIRLDWTNSLIVTAARQNIGDFRDLGFRLTSDEISQVRHNWWPTQLKEMRAKYGACVDPHAIAAFDPRLFTAGQ